MPVGGGCMPPTLGFLVANPGSRDQLFAQIAGKRPERRTVSRLVDSLLIAG
jgi:hypothetical protein